MAQLSNSVSPVRDLIPNESTTMPRTRNFKTSHMMTRKNGENYKNFRTDISLSPLSDGHNDILRNEPEVNGNAPIKINFINSSAQKKNIGHFNEFADK